MIFSPKSCYLEKWSAPNFESRHQQPRSESFMQGHSQPVVTLTLLTCLDVQRQRALKRAVVEAAVDDIDLADAFRLLFPEKSTAKLE